MTPCPEPDCDEQFHEATGLRGHVGRDHRDDAPDLSDSERVLVTQYQLRHAARITVHLVADCKQPEQRGPIRELTLRDVIEAHDSRDRSDVSVCSVCVSLQRARQPRQRLVTDGGTADDDPVERTKDDIREFCGRHDTSPDSLRLSGHPGWTDPRYRGGETR